MGKQVLVLVLFFLASSFLASASRPARKLNSNPDDALGFYDNPLIPPIIKGLLNPIIPYIPDPPPYNVRVPPPPTTPSTPQLPPPSNPTPQLPPPSNPTPVPPSTRTPSPPSTRARVPPSPYNHAVIVYSDSGIGYYNGYLETWWYQIDSNGNVYASPNFFNDPAVPDFVKQQVINLSNYLKNGAHH